MNVPNENTSEPIPANRATDSRSELLTAAKRLFADRGFDGATVKDIADAAGVNVSMVSYFFGGKEGLYRACLEEVGRSNLEIAERLLSPPKTREEFRLRISLYFAELQNVMRANPEVTQILHRECDFEFPIAKEVFRNTFLKTFECFVRFIFAAQERRLVLSQLDPLIAAGILFGGFTNFFRMERVGSEFFAINFSDSEFQEKFLQESVAIMVRALEGEGDA